MKRLLIWLLLVPAGLYALSLAVLFGVQRSMVFMPDPARPAVEAVGAPGLRETEVTAADGTRLLAWWLAPQPGQPVVLYLHGNAGNLSTRAPRVRRFAAPGWGLLFLEWRGYGGNPGQPSEAGFVADAKGAMAHLQALGFRPGQIVLYGESVGTGVAVQLAAAADVAALVLESPYTSIAAIAKLRMPWVPVDLLLRDPFDSLSRIGAVRAPVLMLQGGRDSVVPPSMGRALFAAANEPKQLWAAPEAGHETLMAHGAADVVVEFVQSHVAAGR